MRKLSIKKRIILWFAFVLVIVLALAAETLFVTGDRLARDESKAKLVSLTDRTLKDVRVIDGKLNIDNDVVYYSNDVFIIIYKNDGTIISGLEMESFKGDDVEFKPDTVREIKQGNTSFYVYDRLIENKTVGKTWIRGMTSADLAVISPAIERMIHIFFLLLPVILALALLGGWYITKRAFMPLKELNDTARMIYEDKDLSLRVDVDPEKAGDEVSETAKMFNNMLGELQAGFEAEKRFTDDASHELRIPTAVIMGKAEYALEHMEDDEEIESSLKTILEQSHKMSNLINTLLMFARADRDALTLNEELIDLGLTAEIAKAHLENDAAARGIEIEVDTEDEVYINGDNALIERVFENLISNAVKYGKENGHIYITVKKTEDAAYISVKDDGDGIDEDKLPLIWNRFYTGDESRCSFSMGLGLPLVKLVVELHGGTIDVNSVKGLGTIFEINLPF